MVPIRPSTARSVIAQLQAKTSVMGLPVGATVQFRYRSVIKGGASDGARRSRWS